MSPNTQCLFQPITPIRVTPGVAGDGQLMSPPELCAELAVQPNRLEFHVAKHSLSFPANNPHTGHAWSRARTGDGGLIGEPGNALARKPAPRFQGRYRRGSGPGRVSASEQRRRGAAP